MASPPAEEAVILELRKEKSRDAARSRRGKENYEFYELAKMLPLPGAITSQLDKASIVRLTISYLKLREFSSHGEPPWSRDGPPPNKSVKGGPARQQSSRAVAMQLFETHQGTHILQSLDGFVFALTNDGRFLYVSETVSIYLGLSQIDLEGSSIFDYTHQQDHAELAEQLGIHYPPGGAVDIPSPSSISDNGSPGCSQTAPTILPSEKSITMSPDLTKGSDRCFCIRMKSTLTKRGLQFAKASGFRVVQILSHFRPQFCFTLPTKSSPQLQGIVALALALPPLTINELRLESDAFVLKMGSDFKITFCEPKAEELLDITTDILVSTNFYEHCYTGDLVLLRKAHVDLLTKGQVLTDYFRLLTTHGGFVWIQMCATVLLNSKNMDAQKNIVAICSVISGIQLPECVTDIKQMMPTPETDPDLSGNSGHESESEHDNEDHSGPSSKAEQSRPGVEPPSGVQSENHSQKSRQDNSLSQSLYLDENLNCRKENYKRYSVSPKRALDETECINNVGKKRHFDSLANSCQTFPQVISPTGRVGAMLSMPVDLSSYKTKIYDHLDSSEVVETVFNNCLPSSKSFHENCDNNDFVVEGKEHDFSESVTSASLTTNFLKPVYSSRKSVICTNIYNPCTTEPRSIDSSSMLTSGGNVENYKNTKIGRKIDPMADSEYLGASTQSAVPNNKIIFSVEDGGFEDAIHLENRTKLTHCLNFDAVDSKKLIPPPAHMHSQSYVNPDFVFPFQVRFPFSIDKNHGFYKENEKSTLPW